MLQFLRGVSKGRGLLSYTHGGVGRFWKKSFQKIWLAW